MSRAAGPSRGGAALPLAVATTLVLWASAFPGIRAGLAGYSPGHLALLRFLVASLVMVPFVVAGRARLPRGRDLLRAAGAGLVGVALYHWALNTGEREVSAAAASVLVNLNPLVTALLAVALLGERAGARLWLGFATGLAGALLISWGEGGAMRFSAGTALVLLAAVAQAVYFVVQKPLLARWPPIGIVAVGLWSGTVALLVFAPGLPGALRAAPSGATLAALHLGVFPSAVAYTTWAYALARLPASRAAAFLYAIPVIATGVGWLWLGEVPSPLTVLGGAVALTGVAVGARPAAGSGAKRVEDAAVQGRAHHDRELMATPEPPSPR